MLLVDRLLKAQQFEQALNMLHLVLDPFASEFQRPTEILAISPFTTQPDNVLETIFTGLGPVSRTPTLITGATNHFSLTPLRAEACRLLKWLR